MTGKIVLDTTLCILLFLALAAIYGRVLGRDLVEGSALGFLLLAGCAAFAFIISRHLSLPTAAFGFVALGIAAGVALLLRRWVLPGRAFDPPLTAFHWIVVLPPLIAFYAVNLVQADPSAGIASHQGWDPLYIQASFDKGHFLHLDELRFGRGYLTSISYLLDLLGMTALGRWFGFEGAYAAYNAGSTVASMLGFLVLARVLAGHRLAFVAFALLTLAFLRYDGVYRLYLGYNYSEALIYLGGAIIAAALVRPGRARDAVLMAGSAGIFLVFSRHYGAFYAAVLMTLGFCLVWVRERRVTWTPWLILGLLMCLFTAQELYYVAVPPSPFYPGTGLLKARTDDAATYSVWWSTLNDLGILQNGKFSSTGLGLRSLYLVAFAILVAAHWRRIRRHPWRLVAYGAPFVLIAMPLLLQLLTGYRTTTEYNKVFAVGIFVASWYPCFVIARLVPNRIVTDGYLRLRNRLPARLGIGLGIIGIAAGALLFIVPGDRISGHPLFRLGPAGYVDWALEQYRNINEDLNVARRIREKYGDRVNEISKRPVLYFHYEPGVSLRLHLGGDITKDWDFWSDNVRGRFDAHATLQTLVADLGYPNIYLSYGPGTAYGGYFDDDWQKYVPELLALDDAPWIEDAIRFKTSRFYVVRRPRQ